MRSSANLNAGAKSSLSQAIQGGLMVMAITQLGFILRQIPVACLGAFFLLLGVSLVRPTRMRHFYRNKTLPLFLVAMLGGLAWSLLAGVLLAVVLHALMKLTSQGMRRALPR